MVSPPDLLGCRTPYESFTKAGYTYDASGNLTGHGSRSYAYNAENEITSAAGVNYTYDGDGLRGGVIIELPTGSDLGQTLAVITVPAGNPCPAAPPFIVDPVMGPTVG